MFIKPDVRVLGLRTEMAFALLAAEAVWKSISNSEAYVTSVIDGNHMAGSRHYSGEAIDFRIWNLVPNFDGDFNNKELRSKAEQAATELRRRLTEDYQVVVERTHIHVQFSPRRPYTEEK